MCIRDRGGVVPHTVQHILDVRTVQLQEPGFDHLRRIVVPGNADRLEQSGVGELIGRSAARCV